MGKRFDQYDEQSGINSTDILLIERNPGTTGINYKVTADRIGPFVDVRTLLPLGFVTDGSVDYGTYLSAGITANPNRVILISINLGVGSAITFPSTVGLMFITGGKITKLSSATLSIGGDFWPVRGCFSGFARGNITFGARAFSINPNWWNANASPGTTDMTTAVKCAFGAFDYPQSNYGGEIVFTENTFISDTIATTDNWGNVTIRGYGVSAPQLRMDANVSPLLNLVGTSGNEVSMVTIKDLYLRQNGAFATTVVKLQYAQNIFFNNVRIDHSNRTAGSIGVELGVETPLIFLQNGTYITADTGVKKTTSGNNSGNLYITDCKFENGGIDLQPTGNMIDVQINNNRFSTISNAGQSAISLSSGTFWEVAVNNNNITGVARHGIYISGATYGSVVGNVIRQTSTETADTYDGIYLRICSGMPVIGNSIDGLVTAIRYGIVIENNNDALCVVGNSANRCATGPYSFASASTTNTVYYGNMPGPAIPALDNSGTPSVSGGDVFLTGGTTTITDFDDGYEGKIIRILAEHTLDITDGTNILLAGSTWTMNSGDALTLIQKADGKWYELGRVDNTP